LCSARFYVAETVLSSTWSRRSGKRCVGCGKCLYAKAVQALCGGSRVVRDGFCNHCGPQVQVPRTKIVCIRLDRHKHIRSLSNSSLALRWDLYGRGWHYDVGEGGGSSPWNRWLRVFYLFGGDDDGGGSPLIGGRCPAVGLHGGRHLLLLAVASGFPNGMIDPTGGPVGGGCGPIIPVPSRCSAMRYFDLPVS